MSDHDDQATPAGQDMDEATLNAGSLPLLVHSHYIKDLSLENPNAPRTLMGGQGRPTMEVDFSVGARRIKAEKNKNLFEVTLGVRTTAERGGRAAFLVELQHATLVSVAPSVPEDQVHPLLLIEVPRLAFPFVRQIVADVTQQAGYVPFMLTPVDFHSFYLQRFAGKKDVVEDAA